jgi:hypothetical protein
MPGTRPRLNGQEAAMVTRHLGGRLASEPQRGTLAQADQQRPARQLGNLAGRRGTRHGPGGSWRPALNRGRPGGASGMDHAAAAANGAAKLTHRQPETLTGGSSWPSTKTS